MKIKRDQVEQIVAQAKRDAPNETWGMIGGKNGRALKIYPMRNAHATPVTRYSADPYELLQVVREIEEQTAMDIVAIYHSHPATVGYPSPTDIAEAHYPDSIYILISLMNPQHAVMRGYRIVDGKVEEITLEVEEEEKFSRAKRRARS
ncbi:MAG: M67 family metallopeptidase [Chloroflexi bacterium]|nr:M67 family metallopeptidase [Chloroflexota bacterium]